MTTSPIIHAKELLELYQTENLILFDATNSKNAKANYLEKHLKGALFVDLNSQLADIKDDLSLGGRHPLPTLEKFAKTLTELGISNKHHVVIYDDKNGSNAAARFWWMLKSVGHQKVQVLNGGFKEAEKTGFPICNEIERVERTEDYKIEKWLLPLSDIHEVEKFSTNSNCAIIDVRDNDRYKGKVETIDLVAGHIPGAINIPFSNNLNENELFLHPIELKQKYQNIFQNKDAENIIVHCGSGVTACHTLLAIAYAGLKIPKLYVGSWSEWSRNNKEIAIEK
jgi:thiosulfate/3-mercaptopyruvate sulfurtransferase